MKTTLLVLAWNEIEGMRQVMPRVDPAWVDQILVVDGGSADGTAEYAREKGYDVVVQKERGMRQGYYAGMPLVKGDVMITFSPDGNSIPEAIPRLIAKMREGYDLVIASRYLEHARSHDDDPMTSFGNWMFTKLVNLLHGGRYTDSLVMFRAFKTSLVRDLALDQDSGYQPLEDWLFTKTSWEWLMSIRAARAGLNVGEIPVDEPKRVGGQRKLQPIRWGLFMLWQLLRELRGPVSRAPRQ